jgi:phage baseplate assembly protein W
LSTLQGTVPLNRGFGMDSSIVDEPIPIARARLTGEIITKLQQYEPRIIVTQVKFADDLNGRLMPIVYFELAGGGGL